MKRSENFIVGVILFALTASFTLYGVWEDKVRLFAPLLILIYAALTVWTVSGLPFASLIAGASRRPLPSAVKFRAPSFSSPPGGLPLLLFWLYSLIMIPFSAIPYEAKISTLRVGAYLGVYWATANILSRLPRRKIVWTTIFTALVLIALYSLVQHKVNPEILFGHLRYADYGERLGGTYLCPNHIAHLFQMWIPLCLLFLFLPQFGWFWRICFGYAVPLFVILIYQTQSRAGLLGLVASLATTGLLLMLRKSRRGFYVALFIVPLLGAGAIGGLYAGSPVFRERMQPVVKFVDHQFSKADIDDEFKDFRPQTWADSMAMVKERPLFGVGPGNYGQTFPEYRQRVKANRKETVHPHNEYVEMLAEYGLIGAVLVICVLVSISVPLVRLIKTSDRLYHVLPAVALLAALAGSAVHGFFDFELRIFPNALMLSLLAGCAVAPAMKIAMNKHLKWARIVRWIFSVAILLSALWALQVMSSACLRARGDRARAADHTSGAERLYKMSTAIDPQNWQAHLGLGKIYSQARYYEIDPVAKRDWALKERDAFGRAYRHDTKRSAISYGLGRAELALGRREAGLDCLRVAAQVSRFNDYYWRKLGIELRKAGLYEEAMTAFEHAQKLDRSNKTVKRNIQWIKTRESDVGDQISNDGLRPLVP
ncbi:MAG: O-antigen ligase family protein [Verrucomicrobia bacterium]|nr:O-antigen ligase family protein [Verrucomicrobiota bacterium]